MAFSVHAPRFPVVESMNPLTYLSVLPGLLQKKPGTSKDTLQGRQGQMDANAAYSGMRNSFQQGVDTYSGKFNSAANSYLDSLSQPVGSDAQDSAILGRAREGIDQGARRSTARIANNPAVTSSSGTVGALNSIEHQRLSGQANLDAKVADMNLMQKRQRQEQMVNFLAKQLARNQGGLQQALGAQTGINSQLLGMGRQQDMYNQQQSAGSAMGLAGLLAQLGIGLGDK